jgi:hypothetical protein
MNKVLEKVSEPERRDAIKHGIEGLQKKLDEMKPNAGVITRWENFATQAYQFAYGQGS